MKQDIAPTQEEITATLSRHNFVALLGKLYLLGTNVEKWLQLSRIDSDYVLRYRVPFEDEVYTIDLKYGIRVSIIGGFLVHELGNNIESIHNTFSGPYEECEKYLKSKGYEQKDLITR